MFIHTFLLCSKRSEGGYISQYRSEVRPFLPPLTPPSAVQLKEITRKDVIGLVLATDMKQVGERIRLLGWTYLGAYSGRHGLEVKTLAILKSDQKQHR